MWLLLAGYRTLSTLLGIPLASFSQADILTTPINGKHWPVLFPNNFAFWQMSYEWNQSVQPFEMVSFTWCFSLVPLRNRSKRESQESKKQEGLPFKMLFYLDCNQQVLTTGGVGLPTSTLATRTVFLVSLPAQVILVPGKLTFKPTIILSIMCL